MLAFWLGSVTTDARGHASTDVKLPESLTTYRIMAVAGDKASRFGSGESEIRINKPVVLKAAFPRFLTRGDKAFFGSVVTSQLKAARHRHRHDEEPRSGLVQIGGDGKQSVDVGRRRLDRSALRRDRQVGRPRAHPDDGEAAQRERRFRRHRPCPGAGVAGDCGGLRRGGARCRRQTVRDAGRHRAGVRRPACRARVDGAGRPRRRRALRRRVSVRLRRAACVARAGARCGRRSRRCVPPAWHRRAATCAPRVAERR